MNLQKAGPSTGKPHHRSNKGHTFFSLSPLLTCDFISSNLHKLSHLLTEGTKGKRRTRQELQQLERELACVDGSL